MKSSEKPKVSYVVRLQKQGKLGASDASCLSKSLFYFFWPHSPYCTKLCFPSPWSKSPGILSFILHHVKWYQHLFLLFPESPKYKNNTDDVHDDDNDGDCHF